MIEKLKVLGLSEYEARIIIKLSKKSYNLRELSKISKVPFGKIYSIMKELKNKGYILETKDRPKKIYIDSFSCVISKLIENKKKNDKILFDSLRQDTIFSEKDLQKESQFLKIGITQEDNRKIQLYAFNNAKDEILQILNIHHRPKSNRNNKLIWEKAINDAIKRGVILKSIYPIEISLPDILENLNKEYPDKFKIKRFNTDFIRCDIIDSKSVLLKLVHSDANQYGGIIYLENEKFAENLKSIFIDFWNEATQ